MHRLARTILDAIVAVWAKGAHFSFPEKYSWRWKLEMLTGRYEPETTRLFKRIVKREYVVIDIGAHIGYFTRLAARRVGKNGRVYAFEPDTENRTLLVQNTKRFPNVAARNEAVTDRNGTVLFYHVRGSTGCHSTIAQDDAEHIEVPATTLDAFLSSVGVGRVDVIKMDIEGGEWNALKGMEKTLENVRHLIIEYNPGALTRAGAEPERLLSTLRAKGFSIVLLGNGREIPLSDTLDAAAYLTDGSVNLHCKKL